jgi:hypothetical protein
MYIQDSVCKSVGKSHFGRPNYRWEGNISVDHKETLLEIVDWDGIA